jgi:hypothetical protein
MSTAYFIKKNLDFAHRALTDAANGTAELARVHAARGPSEGT